MEKHCVNRWHLIVITFVCALVVFTGIPANAAKTVILRAGASDPEASTAPALAIGKLCELATKLSNGELNVQPFYQSLGIEQQLAAAVKTGTVDIGFTATPNLAPFTDAFLQFDLPFLFENDKAYTNVLENHPAGKKAIAKFEKDLGVKVLLITSHTHDAKFSGTDLVLRDKQAKVPSDLKGLKIRTSSTPVEVAMMRAYGANPTPVQYSQLYTALQQGVVDGNCATPLPPMASIKLYEVIKYYTAVGFRFNLLPIYINQRKFDSLTPSQQKALLDAAEQVKSLAGQWAVEKVKSAADEFEKAGVHIYHPTKEEREQWMAVKDDLWKEVAAANKGKVDLDVAYDIFKWSRQQ